MIGFQMTQTQSTGSSEKSLFLLDGSALAYRSHFAFIRTPLSNASGLNTGALLGFLRTLLKLIDDESPSHIAVVFDTPAPTFRHEMYAEYKATRQKTPEELIEQLPYMKDLTRALAIPLLEMDGYEADDIIGTLARQASADGYQVNIVSGDKDFMQLVDENVVLYNIMKAEADVVIIDREGVIEKFGVAPEKVVDVLALMGDSSDNVPGVSGVGPKTAQQLIESFGSVEETLERVEEVSKKKVKANLMAERDMALLSKRLVTIDCAVPVGTSVDDLVRKDPDYEKLLPILKELQFNSISKEMAARSASDHPDDAQVSYTIINNKDELDALKTTLQAESFIVLDLETTSLDVLDARIVGLSFSIKSGEAFYVPLNLKPPVLPGTESDPTGELAVLDSLRPLLENPEIKKGGQNIKYDLAVLRSNGVELQGISFDTMLASYVLDPSLRDHGLDNLSLRHFNYTKIKTEELIGKGKNQLTMDLLPVQEVGEYACEDADFTFRLYELFSDLLGSGAMRRLYDQIEVPLIGVLEQMERSGVCLDTATLKSLQHEIGERIGTVEAAIFDAAGGAFNIASPKQLGNVIFEDLKLHEAAGIKPKKTKTGGFSTNQEVLESLGDLPFIRSVLEYRSLTKLLSTYVTALPKLVHPSTMRLHTHYNQAVAATGRLSSSNPNLQNIPNRTPLGRRIRTAFVPTNDDHRLIAADYSQIELRIMAHIAEDPVMIKSFLAGGDIHQDTAARIFNVAPEDVDRELRSRAKAINFGILYGMGAQRLSREVGMTVEEASQFIEHYFETFPSIRSFIDQAHAGAREKGYVETLLGRRRALPEIDSKNGRLRAAAENMAVNTPIQGTAADFIKIAMIQVDKWIREENLATKMILQVHDELIFDTPCDEVNLVLEKVPAIMEGVHELRVPLIVDASSGTNWSEAH